MGTPRGLPSLSSLPACPSKVRAHAQKHGRVHSTHTRTYAHQSFTWTNTTTRGKCTRRDVHRGPVTARHSFRAPGQRSALALLRAHRRGRPRRNLGKLLTRVNQTRVSGERKTAMLETEKLQVNPGQCRQTRVSQRGALQDPAGSSALAGPCLHCPPSPEPRSTSKEMRPAPRRERQGA